MENKMTDLQRVRSYPIRTLLRDEEGDVFIKAAEDTWWWTKYCKGIDHPGYSQVWHDDEMLSMTLITGPDPDPNAISKTDLEEWIQFEEMASEGFGVSSATRRGVLSDLRDRFGISKPRKKVRITLEFDLANDPDDTFLDEVAEFADGCTYIADKLTMKKIEEVN